MDNGQQRQDNEIEELSIRTIDPDDSGGAQRTHGTRTARAIWAVVYAVLFLLVDYASLAIMQWGVALTSTRVQLSSTSENLGTMWHKMVTQGNCVLLLNLIIIALVYLMLLMATNRFWIATPILLSAAAVIAAAEKMKIATRYEAILPSDLNFLGKNTGDLMKFLPPEAPMIFGIAAGIIVVSIVASVICAHFDPRHGALIAGGNKAVGACVRVLLVLAPALSIGGYGQSVGVVDSWGYHVSRGMGDKPSMWDSVYDAQRNGVVVSFLRQVDPKVMDMPATYSKETMDEVAARYRKDAARINETRTHSLDDSTVIYVLSESFSDPTRVPGVELNKDPMPNIRKIKGETTSGLMLSSGYGGGTANLEYMGLTGLSMANFDASLTSPYQQLVPGACWTPSVNQLWGPPENSIGLHPYEPSMYSRETNYKKLGFSHFYALKGDDIISHQDRIDDSPYVSDEATYKSTVEELRKTDGNQFLQVITMQNHMPYNDWYKNNEFEVHDADGSTRPLTDKEKESIRTYAKGMELTDDATLKFLEELDDIDKPVTVVFYGDHLPGIYATAGADTKNSIDLHLTDYFIWSNKASWSHDTKIDDSAYSSPNFFIAQAAEQMNAKVSPYIGFLTLMHEHVAAMEPPVVNTIQGWDRIPEGQAIYLGQDGKPMSVADMDTATKQLLDDYKLIQYDITAGANYLKDTDFMALPK
ncbi:LTA synthase family protein [uncultured Bifidobacterium sp.]|uniref:LTA synthase family protein n=1 Tax=uncultured Bifidobacterium sp. TaxID=165187 RepID=UPI0025870404|nr:LTA synthase family protein [uncultured Bifidobacterium sp.]